MKFLILSGKDVVRFLIISSIVAAATSLPTLFAVTRVIINDRHMERERDVE